MPDPRFSIIHRTYPSGKTVFMARFLNSDGSVYRSLTLQGVKNRKEATLEAQKILNEGIVSRQEDPFIMDFLESFWKSGSDYVRERARGGVILSERYIEGSATIAKRRFERDFRGKRMSDLDKPLVDKAINRMQDDLAAKRLEKARKAKGSDLTPQEKGDIEKMELSSRAGMRTIKIALQTLTVPVRWYCEQNDIKYYLQKVKPIKVKYKERGTLSPAEVGKLLGVTDISPRIKASVLLGALCGLRLGETRGLQWEDVDFENGLITIRHNCPTGSDIIKAPKWDSVRIVPAPEEVLKALELVRAMPESSPSFVIYNQARKDAPIEEVSIPRGFHRMLERIGIDKTEREKRNLCYHGLRHTFVSLSRAGGVPDFVIKTLAGHKSMEMTDLYSHAENILDFQKAAKSLSKIISDATDEAKAEGGSK
jgi:integrase